MPSAGEAPQVGRCTTPCPLRPGTDAPDHASAPLPGKSPAAVGLELLPGDVLSPRPALVHRACPLGRQD